MRDVVFWLAVCFSCALGSCVLCGLLCKAGERVRGTLRQLRRCGLAFVAMAFVAMIHGGTKNIAKRFTADAGLTVTKAELTIPTNGTDNAFLEVSWTGPDESQAIHVRDARSNAWGTLGSEWMFDDRFYANGTNTATWWVYAPATNVLPRTYYHLGSDLPPVEIEGEGVKLLDFADSSTNVVMTYTVERAVLGDTAGTARVEVQVGRDDVWMEVRWDAVYGGVTNTVTIPGFWVGRDTRWRVRLEVDQ